MSTLRIKIANFFAKNSCSAWQKNRPVRKISRKIYRFIMETGSKEYPYADMNFANWPESDEDGSYSLISDSCGFVIRLSPSYVAWKIKQTTGEWPKLPVPGKRAPGEHSFDAKHWDEVLEFNGWQRCSDPLSLDDVRHNSHFVGIIADEGEFGQLLWLDDTISSYNAHLDTGYLYGSNMSTYKDFQKEYRFVPANNNIVWYKK